MTTETVKLNPEFEEAIIVAMLAGHEFESALVVATNYCNELYRRSIEDMELYRPMMERVYTRQRAR